MEFEILQNHPDLDKATAKRLIEEFIALKNDHSGMIQEMRFKTLNKELLTMLQAIIDEPEAKRIREAKALKVAAEKAAERERSAAQARAKAEAERAERLKKAAAAKGGVPSPSPTEVLVADSPLGVPMQPLPAPTLTGAAPPPGALPLPKFTGAALGKFGIQMRPRSASDEEEEPELEFNDGYGGGIPAPTTTVVDKPMPTHVAKAADTLEKKKRKKPDTFTTKQENTLERLKMAKVALQAEAARVAEQKRLTAPPPAANWAPFPRAVPRPAASSAPFPGAVPRPAAPPPEAPAVADAPSENDTIALTVVDVTTYLDGVEEWNKARRTKAEIAAKKADLEKLKDRIASAIETGELAGVKANQLVGKMASLINRLK